MTSEKTPSTKMFMGLLDWTFLLFLAGKLGFGDTTIQSWSWWWVTAPLWVGWLIIFAAAAVMTVAQGAKK